MKKTKLELTWPGKDKRPQLEPRILLEHPERGHHAASRREGDLFDNMLIKGDNLLALKALEQDYAGKVKCIYIDPPFNTGAAFEHYDDGLEHSLWLSLMHERFAALRTLLSDDGYIFVHLDDNEAAYARVLMDEIFGRANYVATVTTTTNAPSGFKATSARIFSTANFILCYRASSSAKPLRRVFALKGYDAAYSKVPQDRDAPIEDWTWTSLADECAMRQGYPSSKEAKKKLGDLFDQLVGELAVELARRVFRTAAIGGGAGIKRRDTILRSRATRDSVMQHPGEDVENFYILNGEQMIFYEDRLVEIDGMTVPGEIITDVWTDIGWTGIAREGDVEFKNGKKPEALIKRILELATNPGDLILDSFGGSGTTGAVAHKMGRRWIMVEIGDHADTHIVPRLIKVVDGKDQGGISKAVGWEGGGGFRYFTLAPSLLERDAYDNWVIAPEYNGPMLAQAMCKHLGFTYDPAQSGDGDERDAEWWRHGRSSERDFLYVTTQALTQDALRLLSEEVGPDRSLLICARAFSGNIDAFENLTCRKIPASILSKCEWGRDDYSLNIAALSEREAADDAPNAGPLFAGEPANG